MRRLVFWGLLPFALPQAFKMRKTAPRFKGAAGPTGGIVGSGTPLRLLAIGDSIIAGVGATTLSKALVGRTAEALAIQLEAEIHWTALGKIGITTDGVIHKLLPEIPEEIPQFILVSAGVNDVTSLKRTATWRSELHSLLEKLSSYAPNALIAVSGLPPMETFPLLPAPLNKIMGLRAKTFDQEIAQLLRQFPNTVHVPIAFDPSDDAFAGDGFHPSETSYAAFGQAMAQALLLHKTMLSMTRDGNPKA